jgi:tetratricopeptide (TPR) repeat protein
MKGFHFKRNMLKYSLLLFLFVAEKSSAQKTVDTTWYNIGEDLYINRQFDAAIYDFSKSITAGYNVAKSYAYRASCKIMLGHIDEASPDLDMAYQTDPSDPLIHFLKARLYIFKQNNDSLLYWAHKAYFSDPQNPDYIDALAIGFMGKQLFDSAITYESKAVKINPQEGSYIGNLGLIKQNAKRYEEAIIDLKAAIKLQPTNPKLFMSMASCYLGLKKYNDALEICNDVLSQYADFALGYSTRGQVYYAMGKKNEACQDFNHLAAMDNPAYDITMKPAAYYLKEYGCAGN